MGSPGMPAWDAFITDRDRAVYAAAGTHVRFPFGVKPVLLVVDTTYAFVGSHPRPILESIKTFHNSCGEEGWAAVGAIKQLLLAARERSVPVVYTDIRSGGGLLANLWRSRRGGALAEDAEGVRGADIVADIAPVPSEVVVTKEGPSAFFGTTLLAHLTQLGADSLIVTGGATSGCVRATVVDAFSYGYNVKVVEEATFDRGQASHAISLFDMDSRYADVVGLQEVLTHFDALRAAASSRH